MSDTKIYKNPVQNVGCTAEQCKYNTSKNCTANHIEVCNESAVKKAETFCSTFEARC